ncbi:MAG: GNAT family N-acetyltransferase [Patescibacteria group bacterium]
MVSIRKAKVKDLDLVSAMAVNLLKYHSQFDTYYRPAKNAKGAYHKLFRSAIFSRRKILLVAEIDSEIIGFVMALVRRKPPVFAIKDYGFITDIFIVNEYRNQGIAGLFLQELFKWFKKNRIKNIELLAHVKNDIGQKFWSKYKFKDFLVSKRIKI